MARENLKGKTLTLKLKSTAFEVRSRAYSLPQHISTASEIEAVALRLLKAELPIEIRLMGMRMSHFLEVRKEAGQQSIASFVRQSLHDVEGDLGNPYLTYIIMLLNLYRTRCYTTQSSHLCHYHVTIMSTSSSRFVCLTANGICSLLNACVCKKSPLLTVACLAALKV